jgi:hypothetical protein
VRADFLIATFCVARFDVFRVEKEKWSVGVVVKLDLVGERKRVKFHYPKNQIKFDEWIDIYSPRIAHLYSETPCPPKKESSIESSPGASKRKETTSTKEKRASTDKPRKASVSKSSQKTKVSSETKDTHSTAAASETKRLAGALPEETISVALTSPLEAPPKKRRLNRKNETNSKPLKKELFAKASPTSPDEGEALFNDTQNVEAATNAARMMEKKESDSERIPRKSSLPNKTQSPSNSGGTNKSMRIPRKLASPEPAKRLVPAPQNPSLVKGVGNVENFHSTQTQSSPSLAGSEVNRTPRKSPAIQKHSICGSSYGRLPDDGSKVIAVRELSREFYRKSSQGTINDHQQRPSEVKRESYESRALYRGLAPCDEAPSSQTGQASNEDYGRDGAFEYESYGDGKYSQRPSHGWQYDDQQRPPSDMRKNNSNSHEPPSDEPSRYYDSHSSNRKCKPDDDGKRRSHDRSYNKERRRSPKAIRDNAQVNESNENSNYDQRRRSHDREYGDRRLSDKKTGHDSLSRHHDSYGDGKYSEYSQRQSQDRSYYDEQRRSSSDYGSSRYHDSSSSNREHKPYGDGEYGERRSYDMNHDSQAPTRYDRAYDKPRRSRDGQYNDRRRRSDSYSEGEYDEKRSRKKSKKSKRAYSSPAAPHRDNEASRNTPSPSRYRTSHSSNNEHLDDGPSRDHHRRYRRDHARDES